MPQGCVVRARVSTTWTRNPATQEDVIDASWKGIFKCFFFLLELLYRSVLVSSTRCKYKGARSGPHCNNSKTTNL